MKHLLNTIIWSLIIHSAFSQDIILKKNGDEIKARVTEIKSETLYYKLWENPDSSVKALLLAEIFMIKYETGMKQVFHTDNKAVDTAAKTDTAQMDYFETAPQPVAPSANMQLEGKKDAKLYYRNKSIFWNAFATGAATPATLYIPGFIVGITMAATPPSKAELMLHDRRWRTQQDPALLNTFKNQSYVEGYQKGAHGRKAGNVTGGFCGGLLTSIMVSLVVLFVFMGGI